MKHVRILLLLSACMALPSIIAYTTVSDTQIEGILITPIIRMGKNIQEKELGNLIEKIAKKVIREHQLDEAAITATYRRKVDAVCKHVHDIAYKLLHRKKSSISRDALEEALKAALARVLAEARGVLTIDELEVFVRTVVIAQLSTTKMEYSKLPAACKTLIDKKIEELHKHLHDVVVQSKNDGITLATAERIIERSVKTLQASLEHDLIWQWFCEQVEVIKKDPKRSKHSAPHQTAESKKRTAEIAHLLEQKQRTIQI